MRLGIIGAGRVGASFILALRSSVDRIGIYCSTTASTQQKAAALAVMPYDDPAALVNDCDVVFITTGDDAVEMISRTLADAGVVPQPEGTVVFHCSGSLGLAPLASLAAMGFHTGSLHPLQSVAVPAAAQLRNIYMAVDGDARACAVGTAIAAAAGSHIFHVPEQERPLYHAAACFCSNYVVTAAAIAQQLMARWMPSMYDAAQALQPLLAGTLDNLMNQEVWQQALTGPVSRGDIGTVQKHAACLPPQLTEAYCSFAAVTAMLALENGTIRQEQYDQLTRILAMAKGDSHE
jgi:predicted short-subunit dehydrogenase-like oxidoreductase (DUF2520 family)